jgi:hypothetical protein
MSTSPEFEQSVKQLILELCEVLYQHGYTKVNIGAVMRVVGVAGENAQDHDMEYLVLDEEFQKSLADLRQQRRLLEHSPSISRTLH